MSTSNNRLNATINLTASGRSKKGGNFRVIGSTSNGPLNITFIGSPLESALALNAHTSNAVAGVTLHSAYQGWFGLSTSHHAATVTRLNTTDDGRRIEHERSADSSSYGYVYSKEEYKKLGRVQITTSNARAALFV